MANKKDNIVELGWRHILCPLARSADPLSWILFIAFLAVVVVAVIARSLGDGGLHEIYTANYQLFWYGAWVLVVLSTVGPIFTLAKEKREVPLGVLIGVSVAHVLIFLALSVLALTQTGNTTAITALLAATVAAAMVGIGWVVQHQSSARSSRRAHTFNILMQSRLSTEFQKQIERRAKYYSAGNAVAAHDVKLFNKIGLEECRKVLLAQRDAELERARDEKKAEVTALYEEKLVAAEERYESLQGVKYLLNFYEFVSAGILLRELDEPLLRETLRDIAIALHRDTAHVRAFQRESQPDAFRNFDAVVSNAWTRRNGS